MVHAIQQDGEATRICVKMLLQGDLPKMNVQGGLKSDKDLRCEL